MFLKMLAFFAATSWGGWMLMLIGFQTKRESKQRSETEHTRTTGTIMEYARGEHRSGRRGVHVYWKPVVEFTADGQMYRAEYPNRMDRNQFPVGTEVDILYDVSNPLHFHLEADPVFTDPGGGAIRISLVWITACGALTLLLAALAGGLRIEPVELEHRIRLLFHHRRG